MLIWQSSEMTKIGEKVGFLISHFSLSQNRSYLSDCDLLFDFISHTQKRFVANLSSFLWKQSGHRNIVNLSQGEIIVVSIRLIAVNSQENETHTHKNTYSQDSSELFCVLFFFIT